MKKADWEKEQKFIDNYIMSGNATQSCVKAGDKKENSAQMGYYLKTKLSKEIAERQRIELNAMSGHSIRVLEELLQNDSASVRFQSAKLILELSGYREQNLRITHEHESSEHVNKLHGKTDEELVENLVGMLNDFPTMVKEEIVDSLSKNNQTKVRKKIREKEEEDIITNFKKH